MTDRVAPHPQRSRTIVSLLPELVQLHGARILVVEDDRDLEPLVRRAAHTLVPPVTVDWATSARQAHALVASACGVAQHLPIVVLTGEDDDEMSVLAIRAGAEDYLVKPLTDVRPVARALRNACERHKRRRAVPRASEAAA